MDAILLIADADVRRRNELRRFFWDSGFLVAAAGNGLECLAELVALEPHVLVIALEIPWGGGDGVIARLNEGLPISRKPLIVVIGDAPCGHSFRANRGGAIQLLLDAPSQRGSAGPDWRGTRRPAVARCGRQAPAAASKHDKSFD